MNTIKKIIGLMCICLAISGCEKTLEIYLGIPLQPENINSVYEPGLNVFGMLKAGITTDNTNHYFEVQQIFHVFDTNTILSVDNAAVTITHHNDGSSKTYMLNSDGDGLYSRNGLQFFEGDLWTYRCIYDTVEITSETRIPYRPIIINNSLKVTDENVSFTLQSDATAFMYDIYYIDEAGFYTKRIVPQPEINTQVSLDIVFTDNSQIHQLYVYAYDKNYEEYITTSNIFFKPNAYRPRFTTVDGGYGCFCSASSLRVELKK